MAGEQQQARFSLFSQLWFRGKRKCFETATSHMQTVVGHLSYFDMNTNFHDFRTDFTEIPRTKTTDWKT
jgi:hypothetical protein